MQKKRWKVCSGILAVCCAFGAFVGCDNGGSSSGEDLTLYMLSDDYNWVKLEITDGEYTLHIQETDDNYNMIYFDANGKVESDNNGEYILKIEEARGSRSVLGEVLYTEELPIKALGEMCLRKESDDLYVLGANGKFIPMAEEEVKNKERLLSAYTLYGSEYDIYLPQNTSALSDEVFIIQFLMEQGYMTYYDGKATREPSYPALDITVDISTSGAKEMTVVYEGNTYTFSCCVCEEGAPIPEIGSSGYMAVGVRKEIVSVGTTVEEFVQQNGVSVIIDTPYGYKGVEDFTISGWDSSKNRTEMHIYITATVDGIQYSYAETIYVCNEEDLDKGKEIFAIQFSEEEVVYGDYSIAFLEKGTDLSGGIPLVYESYNGEPQESTGVVTGYDKDKLGAQLVEIYCEEADCSEKALVYVYDETNLIPKYIDFSLNGNELTAEMLVIEVTYCDGSQESLSMAEYMDNIVTFESEIWEFDFEYYHPVKIGEETYYFRSGI